MKWIETIITNSYTFARLARILRVQRHLHVPVSYCGFHRFQDLHLPEGSAKENIEHNPRYETDDGQGPVHPN